MERAVQELYFYEKTKTAGGFVTALFDLIKRADVNNVERIRKGFPDEVAALEAWNKAGNYGDDLFIEHGLMK